MSTGTVKWFDAQEGYGFIRPDDGSANVFVHIGAVERAGLEDLRKGQKVAFDVARGETGMTSAVGLKAL
ncbi:MAG: cold-shock protein [Proteobacteria bacterium]|nr:cold-shock protein [Pseudomonadota bacterium]